MLGVTAVRGLPRRLEVRRGSRGKSGKVNASATSAGERKRQRKRRVKRGEKSGEERATEQSRRENLSEAAIRGALDGAVGGDRRDGDVLEAEVAGRVGVALGRRQGDVREDAANGEAARSEAANAGSRAASDAALGQQTVDGAAVTVDGDDAARRLQRRVADDDRRPIGRRRGECVVRVVKERVDKAG